jgi:hypothetical protein
MDVLPSLLHPYAQKLSKARPMLAAVPVPTKSMRTYLIGCWKRDRPV